MLIEDIGKLINQLREEQGMTQEDARKEAFKRAFEDMDKDYELEGVVEWEDDGKPSESKGFFRRIIDKLVKWRISDDTEF